MAYTLVERIRRGEAAIAKAKAEGRDVPDWEAHLQQLKRLAASASNARESTEDPILSVGQWYPEFHRFHMAVVHETPDFDYGRLRKLSPDLYRQVKALEDQIDALGAARLSTVMVILREWRGLVLRAEFDRRETRRQSK